MSLGAMAIALGWGGIFAILALRILDSLLGIGFCLHALLRWRWQRLAGKAALGVQPENNLDLLIKLTLWALLFATLLYFGDRYARGNLHFGYAGNGATAFLVASFFLVLSRLRATRGRLIHYWRMSHEFDYAERRRRTQLLR